MVKPWKTEEWKEKRTTILKERDRCQKCGSQKNLCLHHPKGDFSSAEEIRHRLSREAYIQFKRKYEANQPPRKLIETGKCRHKSHHYWHFPEVQHKGEIDESNMEWQKIIEPLSNEEKEQFTKKYTQWQEEHHIKEKIKVEIEKENKRYNALDNVLVLCKVCHYEIHKGLYPLDLCSICENEFKRTDEKTCWFCRPDSEKQRVSLTERQRDYIINLQKDYPTIERDKEFTNLFLKKVGKESIDDLYKEEASRLIEKLIAIAVPLKFPCGDIADIPKDEFNRSQYRDNYWICYNLCPNEIYFSNDCDRFPESKEEESDQG